MKIAIWLDDYRDPNLSTWRDLIEHMAPEAESVVWVKEGEAFRAAVEGTEEVVAIFFDNDLGFGVEEGRALFNWFEEYVHLNGHPRTFLYAQTANPYARKEMRAGFRALDGYWNSLAEVEDE